MTSQDPGPLADVCDRPVITDYREAGRHPPSGAGRGTDPALVPGGAWSACWLQEVPLPSDASSRRGTSNGVRPVSRGHGGAMIPGRASTRNGCRCRPGTDSDRGSRHSPGRRTAPRCSRTSASRGANSNHCARIEQSWAWILDRQLRKTWWAAPHSSFGGAAGFGHVNRG